MRKLIVALVALSLFLSLSACDKVPAVEITAPKAETIPSASDGKTETKPDFKASDSEIQKLESLYAGKSVYHGEFHDHADTGGTSDGKSTLNQWKDMMLYINDMDFATIVDHKQVLHMRLPEWDDTMFIGGSELGTSIGDLSSDCTQFSMHYNLIFSDPESLEAILYAYPDKFQYQNDHFKYPQFRKAELMEIAQRVIDNGGFFTHVHPLGDLYIVSTNPEDYWFGDGTGFEVFCGYYGNMSATNNQEARYYWVKMLDMGKRIFATAGSDSHRLSKTVSLTTVYAPEQTSKSILEVMRTGNFTAGPAGIRMNIGDTMMGGVGSFEDQRLVVSVNDFHSREYQPNHTYRIDVYTNEGLVASQELTDAASVSYFAMDVNADSRYYRVELYDVTGDYIFAIGNPIWNEALYTG